MATETDSRPIWAVPPPAERKPRYTREQIATTALRVADAEGFDAVTMKRVAAELGAGTMTLYYYVRNKADIVALMHDAILADVLIPGAEFPAPWRDAIAAVARRTRQALMAHPWSLASLQEAQFGPNAMRHVEQSLAAVAGTGLPARDRLELIAVVDDYVVGSVLHSVEALTRARLAEADPAMVAAAIEWGTAQLSDGTFPELTALAAAARPPEPASAEAPAPEAPAPEATAPEAAPGPALTEAALTAQFEHGLHALLAGLAERLHLT